MTKSNSVPIPRLILQSATIGVCQELGYTLIDEPQRLHAEQLAKAALASAHIGEMVIVLKEAENALADYIPTIEKTGASLNYGHSVLLQIRKMLVFACE